MSDFHAHLPELMAHYGYWLVAFVIALESMGLPLPGESVLLGASIYAGHTGDLSIAGVIAAGAGGAIIGDNVGYWIGREAGFPLLVRFGPRVGLSHPRIKLGQYAFRHHGGKVVFFGRFVAVLRAMAALLAGANHMRWPRFLVFNASSAVFWAGTYGLAAYFVGAKIEHLLGRAGLIATILAAIGLAVGFVVLRRHEARLIALAEAEFPGPIVSRAKAA